MCRLRPFDTTTAAGRALERQRRALLTTLATVAARLVRVLTGLIAVPLTIGYLGAERYGLWMAISSLVLLLVFADFGIGNGLLNALSGAHGRDDRAAAAEYVASAFYLLVGVALALAAVALLLVPAVPWPRVLNVRSSQAVAEIVPALAVFLGCFLVSVPLGVVQRIQLGLQEGFANGAWEVAGNLAALAALLAAVRLEAGLPWLVLALTGAPALATAANAAVLFARRPWLRPRLGHVRAAAVRHVLRLGSLFFLLQVVSAAAYYSDNLIVARLFGASAAATYAVPMRLFDVIGLVVTMAVAPLWPAYAEAATRGDHEWVARTFRRSLAAAGVFAAAAAIALIALGQPIVRAWTGGVITPPQALLVGFGAWAVLNALGTTVGIFLNGLGRLRFQAVTAVVMGATALALKIVLGRSIGLPGVVFGTVVAYTLCTALPMAIYLPRLLREHPSPTGRPPAVALGAGAATPANAAAD